MRLCGPFPGQVCRDGDRGDPRPPQKPDGTSGRPRGSCAAKRFSSSCTVCIMGASDKKTANDPSMHLLQHHSCRSRTFLSRRRAPFAACPYGDKSEWCSDIMRRDCYTERVEEMCCATCRRFSTGLEGENSEFPLGLKCSSNNITETEKMKFHSREVLQKAVPEQEKSETLEIIRKDTTVSFMQKTS